MTVGKQDPDDWGAKSWHDPTVVKVPVETLKRWRKALEPYWFTSVDEGEEYNNDGVIQTCNEIDALLPKSQR